MLTQKETAAYQSASAGGATQAGLTQLVYTHLAKDLLQAADATRRRDISARCAASEHAFLLLGHLESWLEGLQEAELAQGLQRFYSMLRVSILQGQAHQDAGRFEDLSLLVLETSAAWQRKERSCSPAVPDVLFTEREIASLSFEV